MAVHFRPENGATVSWVWPGSRPTGITTKFTDTGDKFPNTPEEFAKRYGKPPEREDPPGSGNIVKANFPIYAETINTLGLAMEKASEKSDNQWKFKPGVPTNLEIHDFAATEAPFGWARHPIRAYLDSGG